jgi:hypothetical protein
MHGTRTGVESKGCLTKRAADDGWAARFQAFFAASGLLRFDRESQLQPIAANANR